MRRLKTIIFSISIICITAALPVLFVIIPIDKKHVSLNKEERLLQVAEKKSAAISAAIVENSRSIRFLQEKLQEKSTLSFIENSLSVSQLSIESIKPSQGSERNEIHLVLKGEYRALIDFIAQLSRQPNAIVFIKLSIEKNRIEAVLKEDNATSSFVKAKHHLNVLKRLSAALASAKLPTFLFKSISALGDVQSPFVSRVFLEKYRGPFQSLANIDWNLSGEVRKNGVLLGIFLEARNQSQSRYFGVGLSWENSDWRVLNITKSEVIFENSQKHTCWILHY